MLHWEVSQFPILKDLTSEALDTCLYVIWLGHDPDCNLSPAGQTEKPQEVLRISAYTADKNAQNKSPAV